MDPHPEVLPFVESVLLRETRLKDAASKGNKVIGYFCTYTPVELIHAAGFIPVRIWGGSRGVQKAYSLVPSFICPYMRLSLEGALEGEFRFLSGIVQGYTCDVACGVVNIFRGNFGMELVHNLALPYNDNPDARRFLRSGLEELCEKLSRMGGMITETSLEESVRLYEGIRSILAGLFALQSQGVFPLSAADLWAVVSSYFVTPPREYLDMISGLDGHLKDAAPCRPEGIPVVVSGSVLEDEGALAVVEGSGFRVAADDLCTGRRGFLPTAGQGQSPMERMVDRLMNRLPCPSRSHPRDRIPGLLRLVEESGAKGVIFLFQKFCTPHLADHPRVAQALKEAGIPSMAIEMDEYGLIKAQVATRLETFSSMLGH